MELNDIEIFDGKSLSDLFKEIYTNSTDKRSKIVQLIEDIKPFIKTTQDALMLVPVIKEYMDVSVKNDENLIKLAMVIQRIISKQAEVQNANEFGLSEDEKSKLIKEAEGFYDKIMNGTSGTSITQPTNVIVK